MPVIVNNRGVLALTLVGAEVSQLFEILKPWVNTNTYGSWYLMLKPLLSPITDAQDICSNCLEIKEKHYKGALDDFCCPNRQSMFLSALRAYEIPTPAELPADEAEVEEEELTQEQVYKLLGGRVEPEEAEDEKSIADEIGTPMQILDMGRQPVCKNCSKPYHRHETGTDRCFSFGARMSCSYEPMGELVYTDAPDDSAVFAVMVGEKDTLEGVRCG